MDNFVIGNMAWNAGLVAVVGVLFRGWMSRVETSITENRIERKGEVKDLKESIDALSDHVAAANGRTATLETRITTQIALCKQRNEGRRASDRCD